MKEMLIETETTKRLRALKTELFIKGPISLRWMDRVMQLSGGDCMRLGLALWYKKGRGQHPVRVSTCLLEQFYITRTNGYKVLRVLEAEGLVTVERKQGHAPRVTILEAPSSTDETETVKMSDATVILPPE